MIDSKEVCIELVCSILTGKKKVYVDSKYVFGI
jgi:hypothetical protein